MTAPVYSDDFEAAVSDIVDLDYAESEGIDFRVDFSNGYSLWLRDGRCVEGIVPMRLKPKFDEMCTTMGITNYIES